MSNSSRFFTLYKAHAVNMRVPKEKASFLLSILGISIMIGRILIGWISDHPRVCISCLNNYFETCNPNDTFFKNTGQRIVAE